MPEPPQPTIEEVLRSRVLAKLFGSDEYQSYIRPKLVQAFGEKFVRLLEDEDLKGAPPMGPRRPLKGEQSGAPKKALTPQFPQKRVRMEGYESSIRGKLVAALGQNYVRLLEDNDLKGAPPMGPRRALRGEQSGAPKKALTPQVPRKRVRMEGYESQVPQKRVRMEGFESSIREKLVAVLGEDYVRLLEDQGLKGAPPMGPAAGF
ncbi:hypothetical protein AC578_1185 [Pseudocercospora eumusae]|uniref:Uncharacterized protein n=1 Tax=Pseudocercospora eumusae TaxID=321146 RepID=A0A139H046_9PEZI|nr:hypothetical protein AC578_1185 [Pseudocercospora eumusae]